MTTALEELNKIHAAATLEINKLTEEGAALKKELAQFQKYKSQDGSVTLEEADAALADGRCVRVAWSNYSFEQDTYRRTADGVLQYHCDLGWKRSCYSKLEEVAGVRKSIKYFVVPDPQEKPALKTTGLTAEEATTAVRSGHIVKDRTGDIYQIRDGKLYFFGHGRWRQTHAFVDGFASFYAPFSIVKDPSRTPEIGDTVEHSLHEENNPIAHYKGVVDCIMGNEVRIVRPSGSVFFSLAKNLHVVDKSEKI
jgi:hypothetical protein